MISVCLERGCLVLAAAPGDLAPRHESQLAFWGFHADLASNRLLTPSDAGAPLVEKVTRYLSQCDCPYMLTEDVQRLLEEHDRARGELEASLEAGRRLKDGSPDASDAEEFSAFLESSIPRKLKDHQYKAALHLLAVRNGANFSVPGSGKTAVLLAVFEFLRKRGEVDALFVVGPPACFGPWRVEYEATLGRPPSCVLLAAGDIDERRSRYEVTIDSVCDLYLTSFQTLQRDWEYVSRLFRHQGIRFFFVVDEAHYIKHPDGVWATAAMEVSRHSARRCILTGTPFPQSYMDAFNLSDVLWPESPPISESDRIQIALLTQKKKPEEAARVLDGAFSPLFYRVRKQDLHLAPQRFHAPILVEMNHHERLAYTAIVDRIREASRADGLRDLELILRLRRGRIMRLRQCLSYAAMLSTALDDYSEDLLVGDPSLADTIQHYDEIETPGKVKALMDLLAGLRSRGEKVVVWSNFVRALELIRDTVERVGIGVRLIYGATPFPRAGVSEETTREGILRDFVRLGSGVDVLVANPAACAESVSLHKTCSHAIYYDLSYNCAQYLQSLDRIHRVGGSETREAHYDFLLYRASIDEDILDTLRAKSARMSAIIDKEYPIYSLDMFSDEDELAAYDRLFGNES